MECAGFFSIHRARFAAFSDEPADFDGPFSSLRDRASPNRPILVIANEQHIGRRGAVFCEFGKRGLPAQSVLTRRPHQRALPRTIMPASVACGITPDRKYLSCRSQSQHGRDRTTSECTRAERREKLHGSHTAILPDNGKSLTCRSTFHFSCPKRLRQASPFRRAVRPWP